MPVTVTRAPRAGTGTHDRRRRQCSGSRARNGGCIRARTASSACDCSENSARPLVGATVNTSPVNSSWLDPPTSTSARCARSCTAPRGQARHAPSCHGIPTATRVACVASRRARRRVHRVDGGQGTRRGRSPRRPAAARAPAHPKRPSRRGRREGVGLERVSAGGLSRRPSGFRRDSITAAAPRARAGHADHRARARRQRPHIYAHSCCWPSTASSRASPRRAARGRSRGAGSRSCPRRSR